MFVVDSICVCLCLVGGDRYLCLSLSLSVFVFLSVLRGAGNYFLDKRKDKKERP